MPRFGSNLYKPPALGGRGRTWIESVPIRLPTGYSVDWESRAVTADDSVNGRVVRGQLRMVRDRGDY